MFDYDNFIGILPSDIRFSKLFPNDIERWTRCRDHETEWLILLEYEDWAKELKDYDSDPERVAFYRELHEDIEVKYDAVDEERKAAFQGVRDLARWEYEQLDQDGDTKGIQAWSHYNWELSWLHVSTRGKEVWESTNILHHRISALAGAQVLREEGHSVSML